MTKPQDGGGEHHHCEGGVKRHATTRSTPADALPWVVKVIATDSGEVIRQIPSETALKLAQNLSDASSVLFDSKA